MCLVGLVFRLLCDFAQMNIELHCNFDSVYSNHYAVYCKVHEPFRIYT